MLCPPRQRWGAGRTTQAPAGAALVKDEPGIELDAVLPEKLKIFLLKAHLTVVLFLVVNVAHHPRKVRRTDGKRSVTLLPCEALAMIVHPFG